MMNIFSAHKRRQFEARAAATRSILGRDVNAFLNDPVISPAALPKQLDLNAILHLPEEELIAIKLPTLN